MIKSREMRWVGRVALMGEERRGMRVGFLWESQKGKRPLRRPRRKWEDKTKMDLREIGWGGMEWINVTQDRDQWRALVTTVMILRFR
jgi:hypothetical protein